mmetsp:Transcript_18172/g.57131  ORF Transcript_18172/g.57131 Transcript_18172/m.57131 type:complete len:329 (-) Transcript_18172:1611-2597(-)
MEELVLDIEDNLGLCEEVFSLDVLRHYRIHIGQLRDEEVEHENCAHDEERCPQHHGRHALLLVVGEVFKVKVAKGEAEAVEHRAPKVHKRVPAIPPVLHDERQRSSPAKEEEGEDDEERGHLAQHFAHHARKHAHAAHHGGVAQAAHPREQARHRLEAALPRGQVRVHAAMRVHHVRAREQVVFGHNVEEEHNVEGEGEGEECVGGCLDVVPAVRAVAAVAQAADLEELGAHAQDDEHAQGSSERDKDPRPRIPVRPASRRANGLGRRTEEACEVEHEADDGGEGAQGLEGLVVEGEARPHLLEELGDHGHIEHGHDLVVHNGAQGAL